MTTINVKKKSQAALLLAVALMFAISIQSCSEEKQAQAKSLEQIHKDDGVPVKTITVVQKEFSKSLNFYAKLSGKVESSQTAKIGDIVQKVNAKVGDFVKKGDIIIEMPVNNPNMRYEQAKIGLATLKKTYDRMKVLLDAGEMSQQKFDEVEAQYKVNLKNVESIESLLFIEAPITGTIISMVVHEGDMITLNMGQPTPIFTVSALGTLKSTVWVSESEMPHIKKGMPVSCEYAGETFRGRITNVYPAMDISKNAFPVELELNNPKKILKSGTTVNVNVKSYSNAEVIVLPVNIIKKENDKFYVYVESKGTAMKKYVSVGERNGINTEILEGLTPGEKVISEGISLIKDGTKIKNVN